MQYIGCKTLNNVHKWCQIILEFLHKKLFYETQPVSFFISYFVFDVTNLFKYTNDYFFFNFLVLSLYYDF